MISEANKSILTYILLISFDFVFYSIWSAQGRDLSRFDLFAIARRKLIVLLILESSAAPLERFRVFFCVGFHMESSRYDHYASSYDLWPFDWKSCVWNGCDSSTMKSMWNFAQKLCFLMPNLIYFAPRQQILEERSGRMSNARKLTSIKIYTNKTIPTPSTNLPTSPKRLEYLGSVYKVLKGFGICLTILETGGSL